MGTVEYDDLSNKKGTEAHQKVRGQLVSQEFASGERRDDLYAASPPVVATRLLLARLACSCGGEERPREKNKLGDVKKAFLSGTIKNMSTMVQKKWPKRGKGGWAKTRGAMCGTGDAVVV